MRNFIVKFVPHDEKYPQVIHKIRMPDFKDKGFYRDITSWNAFCSGSRRGLTKEDKKSKKVGCCWSPDGLYYTHEHVEQEWLKAVERRFKWAVERFGESKKEELEKELDERKFPVVEHNSIWDFYKYIEFDHKARKYIK